MELIQFFGKNSPKTPRGQPRKTIKRVVSSYLSFAIIKSEIEHKIRQLTEPREEFFHFFVSSEFCRKIE